MKKKQRLLLFDIDGTLLDSGGAGALAFQDASELTFEVHRDELSPLDLAGATDGSVLRKLFADVKREHTPALEGLFWENYLERLQYRVSDPTMGTLHPGVLPLLEAIQGNPLFSVGLLTGNIRRGAMIKLERFALSHFFIDGGFGDDSVHRNELGPFAVQRIETATRRCFTAEEIIVIGDTPKDIACAEAISARCLAVGTGSFSVEALAAFTPWKCLPNLSETAGVLSFLEA